MKKRLPGPISRPCNDSRYSFCGAKLSSLDWSNWFQDGDYIHVRRMVVDHGGFEEETWHRVHAKRIGGRDHTRISVVSGVPHWLHDKI